MHRSFSEVHKIVGIFVVLLGSSLLLPHSSNGASSEKIVYTFGGNVEDGVFPEAGLVADKNGVFYGTTIGGGVDPIGLCNLNNQGCGTVFSLTPPTTPDGVWTETVLYKFTDGNDGGDPDASLILKNNILYGTTLAGGVAAPRKLRRNEVESVA